MNTYRIPVVWSVTGVVEVKAERLFDAMIIAEDAPLPVESNYLEDSFSVDQDAVENDEEACRVKA